MTNVPNDTDAPQRRSEDERAPDPVDLAGMVGSALGELASRVARLEEQLAGMAGEVRTRRLVVVDGDGAERITAGMHPRSSGHAEVKVLAPGDDESWAALAAYSEDGGLPAVDLSLSVGGSTHSAMRAAPAVAWSDGPPEGASWSDTRSELMVAGRTVAEGCSNSGGSATGVPLPVDELRARRLVIVDEAGEERVVASAGGGASLQLHTADPDDFLELSAWDGGDFDPTGPELSVRAWLGGEQIISHTAWRHGFDGGTFDRAQLAHEGDGEPDVFGKVERIRLTTSRPTQPAERTEERPRPAAAEPELVDERVEYEARCLVADAEQALRLVHDVVSRYQALDGDGSRAAVVEESAGRTADLLMVTHALLRHRVVTADSAADQLAERLEAEGLA
jgi:hypothetical protein